MPKFNFAAYIKGAKISGVEVVGHSPFRDDQNPSFCGNTETGLWIDHGTKESGNWTQFCERLGLKEKVKPRFDNEFWADARKTGEYDYFDENDSPILRVERYESSALKRKSFVQKHFANGKWLRGKSKVPVCPYRWSKWKDSEEAIFFVEGEKCVLALEHYGMSATTLPGGSGVTKGVAYVDKYFRNKKVWILPDNDAVGHAYAERIAAIVNIGAVETKVVKLPNLNSGEDVVEWLQQGGTPEGLKRLCENTQAWSQSPRSEDVPYKTSGEPFATAEDYFQFFEFHLSKPKRDIITGELVSFVDGLWQPACGRLDVLGSHAYDSSNIKKTRLKEHLARFAETKKPELLIDVPSWDGVDRIRQIASCVHVTNCSQQHFYEFLCDWGAKIFRRIETPSYQNRILVFQGPQGVGKDHLMDEITSGLGQFTANITITNNERDTQAAIGSLVVAKISEFDRTARTEVSTLKDLITRDHTFIRLPYDRASKHRFMRCSFMASINISEILRDHTGNRRFLIFNVEKIEWSYPTGQGSQILAQFKNLAANDFRASAEAEKVMQAYVGSQTPDDPQEAILEIFDERIENLETNEKKQFSSSDVQPIVSDLAKSFGKGPNAILHILKINRRSLRTNKGIKYFRNNE